MGLFPCPRSPVRNQSPVEFTGRAARGVVLTQIRAPLARPGQWLWRFSATSVPRSRVADCELFMRLAGVTWGTQLPERIAPAISSRQPQPDGKASGPVLSRLARMARGHARPRSHRNIDSTARTNTTPIAIPRWNTREPRNAQTYRAQVTTGGEELNVRRSGGLRSGAAHFLCSGMPITSIQKTDGPNGFTRRNPSG